MGLFDTGGEKEKRQRRTYRGKNLPSATSDDIKFLSGPGQLLDVLFHDIPLNTVDMVGSGAKFGYDKLLGTNDQSQQALFDWENSIKRVSDRFLHMNKREENTVEDLLHSYSFDFTTNSVFDYLNSAKGLFNTVYDNTLGYPGSSLPDTPQKAAQKRKAKAEEKGFFSKYFDNPANFPSLESLKQNTGRTQNEKEKNVFRR